MVAVCGDVTRPVVTVNPAVAAPCATITKERSRCTRSMLVRVAGDAAGQLAWTRFGALLNALALAAFIVSTVSAAVRGKRSVPVR